MDATQAGEIKAKGMVYVPTCAITQVFNASDDKKPSEWSELSWGKGKAVLPIHRNAVRAAVEAGVTILTGTDCP
jgi:imidazolonepropionase-like amidohydrolase